LLAAVVVVVLANWVPVALAVICMSLMHILHLEVPLLLLALEQL